jgi:polyisoprenoid-binding protein YceI
MSRSNVAGMAVGGARLRFGPDTGTLVLHTRRAGVASKLGHDLTLVVTAWSAEVDVPNLADSGEGRVDATVDLFSVQVREGTGGAVPLTDRDRREIERTAQRILEVDRYPTATFSADRIDATAGGGTIGGTLTIRGTPAPLALQVRKISPNRWRVAATVTQSAFGIRPYSAFLGALKLRDEVEVECEVQTDR